MQGTLLTPLCFNKATFETPLAAAINKLEDTDDSTNLSPLLPCFTRSNNSDHFLFSGKSAHLPALQILKQSGLFISYLQRMGFVDKFKQIEYVASSK